MQAVLLDFIAALRLAQLPVSPAETLDASRAVAEVGLADRQLLHDTLAVLLAKTADEKQRFDRCFELFFERESHRLEAPGADGEAAEPDAQTPAGQSSDAAATQSDSNAGRMRYRRQIDADEDELPDQGIGGSRLAGSGGTSPQQLLQRAGVDAQQPLLRAIIDRDTARLALEVQSAGRGTGVDRIRYATQRSLYSYRLLQALGLPSIDEAIEALNRLRTEVDDLEQADIDQLIAELEAGREQLQQQAAQHVDEQFELTDNAAAQEIREKLLREANLSQIEQRYFSTMQELVRKMAKALAAKHAQRRRVTRRGQLDVGKTIRRNMSNQGVLFNTYWKTRRKSRPDIFAICDVSGSVSAHAKFLLMFLYSLSDVLPNTRSFAFSSSLGEVTDLFQAQPVARAIEEVNQQWGMGATSYGDSLDHFAELALDDVRSNSTVIILGDARNNGGDPNIEVMRTLYNRARSVIWLNPEPRLFWSVGDSEMRRYLSCVHRAQTCQSLQDLERFVSHLLRIND